MKFTYFPGCSLQGLGRAYDESLQPVFRALGIELTELEDWNCCGATAYMAVDEAKAFVLAARNLALAEKNGGHAVLAPCSACYLVLNKAKHAMAESRVVGDKIRQALAAASLRYEGRVPVRHPLDVLLNDVGLEAIRQRVTEPLRGLKVATYYGCQMVRPYATFDDQYNPTTMDRLVEALGATVVRYPLKTKCCGGSLTGTLPEAGLRLAYILLKEAMRQGAQVIATVCPLCHFNLDAYHVPIGAKYGPVPIPTVYFTQLMGLAFGLPRQELGFHRAVVPFRMPAAAPAAAGATA